jgi:hypothetical protein
MRLATLTRALARILKCLRALMSVGWLNKRCAAEASVRRLFSGRRL